MQRVSGGYTIIELMIVLAITGVLIAISLFYLSGRLEADRFSQSMRDIQSKIQDWINDVPTGFAGSFSTSPSDVVCNTTGPNGHAQIKKNSAGSTVSSGDCIFLGKAIQFTDRSSPPTTDQDKMVYAYSIFGNRNITNGSEDREVANLVEAKPIPADAYGSNGNADITEAYRLTGSSKVLSVTSDGGVTNSHLAGFYLSFNQESASRNGSQDIRAYQYPIPGNLTPGNESGLAAKDVNDCITMSNPGLCTVPLSLPPAQWDQWPPSLLNWRICFGNDSNDETALLTISSSNGIGAATKLEFKACS